MMRRVLLLLMLPLSLSPWLACAQGTIYESKDKAGPVYSDVPSPGARPIDLQPPNIIETPKAPAQAPSQQPQQTPPEAAPAPYTQLLVLSPANEDTVWSNTGAFDLQVQLRPALNTGRGDNLRVRIDGKPLAKGYNSAAISIQAADWASAAATDNVEHRLQVAVVDAGGAVLLESAPVRFFLRRHTLRRQATPRAP